MTKNIAFLFPGQGSQFVGMGKSFVVSNAKARNRIEEANEALGFDIGKLINEGPEAELKLTANTQPAILLVSVIACEALLAKRPIIPRVVAGHSLGEFSACWSAGSIEFFDVIRLVRKRGELMQSAVPYGKGAMAAIIGLAADTVSLVCAEAGGDVAPANFNSPEQTVIAGEAESVMKAVEIAKSKGAKKAVNLPVSAPFHTKMMTPAKEGLAEFIKTITIEDPKFPVLRNVDGETSTTTKEIEEALIAQVTGCVRWVDSMKKIGEIGVSLALEIGPGKVLGGLMRRINKSVKTMQVGSVDDVDRAVEAL